ncbi:hypothetical protein I79_019210 [Cricetulus griseus]|uniref:Uncharacterized protein n=1 Tax=Cricetulus griseus TaxID=10029 RepID=G3I6T2_CRIGR|nr:hypothetical protein I79_019210 [Cricetulus griseus]
MSGHTASGSASVKWTRALTQGTGKHPCPQYKSPLHCPPISFTHFQIERLQHAGTCVERW